MVARVAGARGRIGAASVLVVLGCVTAARAGNVPSTALSASLRLDPILVNGSHLLFQFPQIVATADTARRDFGRIGARSMLFAYPDVNMYPGDATGMGATWRGARTGGFVLSQLSYLPGRNVGGGAFYSRSNILQVGAGTRWRGLRAGAALRGARDRREDGSNQDATGANQDRLQATRSVGDYLEGAVGAGASLGPAQIDLAIELPWQRYDIEGIAISAWDTLGLLLGGETSDALSAAARLATPLGRGAQLVVGGIYRLGHLHWTGHTYDGVRLVPVSFDQGLDAWSATASLSFPAPHVERVAISGRYARRRYGLADWAQPLASSERKDDTGALVLACRKRLWTDLHLHAGVSREYSRARFDQTTASSRERREQATLTESIGDGFAWGLAWSWQQFEFASSLSTTLQLADPLLRLDVHFEL